MALRTQSGDSPAAIAGTSGSPTPPAKRKRRRWPLLLVGFLVLVIGGFALYVWSTLYFSYSSGERAGFVQKFSRRGWICKTWEGELAMVSLPGTMPEIFHFTVRDEAVAKSISEGMGSRVAVHYEQHRGVPTSCFGDTEYFVTEARPTHP